MIRDYKIDLEIAIQKDNIYVDLHNFYLFKQIEVDIYEKNISLTFYKNQDFASTQTPYRVKIYFENVEMLEVSPTMIMNSEGRLEEIGFKKSDDNDLDWLICEKDSSLSDHIVFRFLKDEYIRISAIRSRVEFAESV